MKFEQALAAMRENPEKQYLFDGKVGPINFNDLERGCIGLVNAVNADWIEYQEPKWEPKAGEYFCQLGFERDTVNQAEAATKKLRTFSRLLAYVDEFSEEGEERDHFVFRNSSGKWGICWRGHDCADPTLVLMSKRVAEKLCDDLNSGRVEL